MFEIVNDNKDLLKITKEHLNINVKVLKILVLTYSSLL